MSEPFKFSTQVRVRFNETDAQGHVNFAHYLSYFDVALTDYLRAIGYTYLQMLADDVDMLYVGTQTRYVSPAYFEEVLNIHAHTGHIGHSSVRFEFQVFANADRGGIDHRCDGGARDTSQDFRAGPAARGRRRLRE